MRCGGSRIPRVVAVVFSVGLALAIIGGVGALVGSQIVEVAGDLPLYQTTIEKKVGVLRSATLGRIAEVASRFRGTLGQAGQISPPSASPAGEQAARPEQTPVPVEVRQPPPDPVALATRSLDAGATSARGRSDHLHCGHLYPDAAG